MDIDAKNLCFGLVGCGTVGRSWAVCFLRAGARVRLYSRRRDPIDETIHFLEQWFGSEAATGDGAWKQRLEVCETLEDLPNDCDWIQENVAEDAEQKAAIFERLDQMTPDSVILASSTSALLPERFIGNLAKKDRCLVAHPINPPHLCPAVEMVPAATTSAECVNRSRKILEAIGQVPILVRNARIGFVVNRLQSAILDEAFNLVAHGCTDIEGVDAAIKHGLALRWAFMGPFETIDLNAPEGVEDYLGRYRDGYEKIAADRENRHAWRGELAQQVVDERRQRLPADQLDARRQWRDQKLAALVRHLRGT